MLAAPERARALIADAWVVPGCQGIKTLFPDSRPTTASSWTAGGSGQRPLPGDVDLQLAGVDAGDEPGELGGVAAREDLHRVHPRPASSKSGNEVLTKAPPLSARRAGAAVSSGLLRTRSSTTSNRCLRGCVVLQNSTIQPSDCACVENSFA
jgi:hypothetical protein